FQVRLAVEEPLVAPLQLGQLRVDLLFLREDPLLDLDDAPPVLHDFLVDLGAQQNGLLARADLGLAPEGLGFALGLGEHQLALLLGGAETRLPQYPDRDRNADSPHDQSDQNPDCDQHAQLLGRLAAALPRSPPRRLPAWTFDEASRQRGS